MVTLQTLHNRLLRFAIGLDWPSGFDAEDAVQETLLRVWRMHPEMLQSDHVYGYCWVAMMHIGSDWYQRDCRRRQVRHAYAAHLATSEQGDLRITIATSGAIFEIGDLVRSHEVLEALEALHPGQRQCIELHVFEGFTHTQIAERLDVPRCTVGSRIMRGKERLRLILAPESKPVLMGAVNELAYDKRRSAKPRCSCGKLRCTGNSVAHHTVNEVFGRRAKKAA